MCAECANEANSQAAEEVVDDVAAETKVNKDEEIAQLREQLKRVAAEADNFRRRQEANLERRVDMAKDDVFRKLLPLLDHLEMASAAAKNSNDAASLAKGVDLVIKDLTKVFEGFGVKPIETAAGEDIFDPSLHEAVMVEEREDLPDETVSLVLKKGYLFNDRVLRPSMVKVARHSS